MFKYVVVILFFVSGLRSQNLIINGDFESLLGCPTNVSQLTRAVSWINPSTGTPQQTTGSPDLFNACSLTSDTVNVPLSKITYQQAYNGQGYAGIYLYVSPIYNCREYIEAPLSTSLTANVNYYFSMRVNLANTSKYTTSSIGVYFSDTLVANIPNYKPLPFVPQITNPTYNYFDTLTWRLISGNYVAHGGEKFLIIGNFLKDSSSLVKEIDPTGFYNAYGLIDDVVLTANSTGLPEPYLDRTSSIFPNPVSGNELFFHTDGLANLRLKIYDQLSELILDKMIEGKSGLDISFLPAGCYYYQILKSDMVHEKGKLLRQ